MRCGRTFRLARTHPAHARSSGSETLSRSRSLAGYTIDTHESGFSEATPDLDPGSGGAEPEQLAMKARHPPQRFCGPHQPDRRAQSPIDLRSPPKRGVFPPPVPTEAGSMPTYESLGTDDRDGLEDRWKPSI